MLDVAIVGAGPYGLSIAAHLRRAGIPFRIFGRPMDSWQAHMPKGMRLKSDGFASTINDPDQKFTLKHFCEDRGIEYRDTGIPVKLETFVAFGLAFKERILPELENKLVTGIEQIPDGFQLTLEGDEKVKARRVVMAVGITHFAFIPSSLAQLPSKFVSHSFQHYDLEPFRGKRVAVIGGGASATELAGLLNEAGCNVQLVSRRAELAFHNKPNPNERRSLWQQIRHPQSGLGPGLRSWILSTWPNWFHRFPKAMRVNIVRTHLGPSGGWFVKDMVIGKVPLVLGYSPERAEVEGDHVRLHLCGADGSKREIETDHIICATGYHADMDKLKFISPSLRAKLKTIDGSPVLSQDFESSVPGLFFLGLAAAYSFGPLMRFAYGAPYSARHLCKALANSRTYSRASVAKPSVVGVAE